MFSTEMPSALASLWQLAHVRPLVPRLAKNGFVAGFVSIEIPDVETTSSVPNGSVLVIGLLSPSAVSSARLPDGAAEQPRPPPSKPAAPNVRPSRSIDFIAPPLGGSR